MCRVRKYGNPPGVVNALGVKAVGIPAYSNICIYVCMQRQPTYSHDYEHVCIGFVCFQPLGDGVQQLLDAATLLTAGEQG